MSLRIRIAFVAALLVFAAAGAADEEPWTWAGIEILGNHDVPRAEIEKIVTVPVGESYRVGDAPFWKDACATVKQQLDFADVSCPDRPLRVFDGRKAYLVVDIVEKGNEKLLRFRKPPSKDVPFANDEMLRVLEELQDKTLTAAMAGHAYQENGAQGHLVYVAREGDEDVSPLVDRLAAVVPQYRENLLAILRLEKDAEKRQQAANLLNWAGGDLEKLIRDSMPYLDDPDAGVRNNLSRFMIAFVDRVKKESLRHELIDAFVLQIRRPSHGDRNKGVYNLLGIAQARPENRAYIREAGGDALRYLADNSIVFNVRDPARELLALVETP